MKKIVCLFIAFTMICVNSNLIAFGDGGTPLKSAPVAEFTYTVSGGEVTITGIRNTVSNLVIPQQISGNPVTVIGDNAFSSNNNISSVTIPAGVRKIGDFAFSNCENLVSAIIPDTIETLGRFCFFSCIKLKALSIPKNVSSIGRDAFNSTALSEITVNSDNTYFRSMDGVLYDHALSTLIYYPTNKAGNAFAIPESVTAIAISAINNSNLKSLTISKNVATIEANSIICYNIISINVDSANTHFSNYNNDGILYTAGVKDLIAYPNDKPGSTYSIPDTVQRIRINSLNFCDNLRTVMIPVSVAAIDNGAMDGVNINEIIVDPANPNFSSIDGVLFNKTQSIIEKYPRGKTSTIYSIPNGVNEIQSICFNSPYIKTICIPASVTTIGVQAFLSTSALKTAVFYGDVYNPNPEHKFIKAFDYFDLSSFKILYPISKSESWAQYTGYTTQPFCTLSMDLQDGNTPKTCVAPITSGHISAPPVPTRQGYTFAGWYKEPALITQWNFSTDTVVGDITLYAKWGVGAPANIKALSDSYNSVIVSWSEVNGASGYEVFRATAVAGPFSLCASVSTALFKNAGLTTGKKYYYKVRSYQLIDTKKVYTGYSAIVSATPVPAKPTVTAKKVSTTKIKVAWSAIGGATKYEVWGYKTSVSGTYSLLSTTAALSYLNSGITPGKTYWYMVRAYRLVNGKKVYGAYSSPMGIR